MEYDFSLIIPARCEPENIFATLTNIQTDLRGNFEVLVITDSTEDTTKMGVEKFLDFNRESTANMAIRLLENKRAPGFGYALIHGFQAARSGVVVVVMADLSDPILKINEMLLIFRECGADIVCASRYIRGGRQRGGPLIKRLLSRLAGLSLYHLARIPTTDVTNNFCLYRKEALLELQADGSSGFAIGMEIKVKAHLQGMKIREIPTSWDSRSVGRSHFVFMKALPKYFKWYFHAIFFQRNCTQIFGGSSPGGVSTQ